MSLMKFNTKIGSRRRNSLRKFYTIKKIKFNLIKIRKKMLMSKIGKSKYYQYFIRHLNRIKFGIYINITSTEAGKLAYANNSEYLKYVY